MDSEKRRFFSVNVFERRVLNVIFASVIFPLIIIGVFLYFMFRDLVVVYFTNKLASQLFYQYIILAMILFIYYMLFVGIVIYRFVHKLVGVFPRLISEIDERLSGRNQSPIDLRHSDHIHELVDRINKLIDKKYR